MPITPDQIKTELNDILAALAEATAQSSGVISIDLTPVALQATKLCDHIISLPPAEALKILPELQYAVEKLDELHKIAKGTP